ncbi:2OG-Fe(II) oxygenase [Amycolatopsis sp. NPDC003861]
MSTVGGESLRQLTPWLFALYEGEFLSLAGRVTSEPVSVATRDKIAVNLNIQHGKSMRYEAHVDSNPVEGLLYVTDHPIGSGGELVVAQRADAVGVAEIDEISAVIHPVAGHLIFFDARQHAHYVRSLTRAEDSRIVVAMNFYTPSCPESARPADLDEHLFGHG